MRAVQISADSFPFSRCRRHAEVMSQRALDSLCAQMQCKGIVLLGEIVDGGDDEVFLSM
jgi:hypothetical protein